MTAGFSAAAEAHRKLLKNPALPFMVVPHPIISMSEAELRASADAIFGELAAAISRPES